MNCQEARGYLLDWERGHLGPELSDQVRLHVESCAACAHEATADRALSELLERQLPQYAAPLALKRRLAASWPLLAESKRSWWTRWGRPVIPATAVAVLLLALMPVVYRYGAASRLDHRALVAEAVNDHVRVLSSPRRVDVESSDMHQVKPWFEGRLDFAPVVRFLGDDEFPLEGGATGYFVDRQAAVFVFRRRLHVISLLVFRADGLPWPDCSQLIGQVPTCRVMARGFNVLLWRGDELGYALVSDVGAGDLAELAGKLISGPS